MKEILCLTDWTLKTSIRESELIMLSHCWICSLSVLPPRDFLCQRWVTGEICIKDALFSPSSHFLFLSLVSLSLTQTVIFCVKCSASLCYRNILHFSTDTLHSCCSSEWTWFVFSSWLDWSQPTIFVPSSISNTALTADRTLTLFWPLAICNVASLSCYKMVHFIPDGWLCLCLFLSLSSDLLHPEPTHEHFFC